MDVLPRCYTVNLSFCKTKIEFSKTDTSVQVKHSY